MPSLDAFLQVIAGAGGTGAVLGLWLYVTWRDNKDLKAEIKALNGKVEARDAQRLLDHQTALAEVTRALQGEIEDEEPQPRSPTGRRTGGRHERTG